MNQKLKALNDIKFGHFGSCRTAYNGISAVYDLKKTDEKFILSNGHAAGALYCVLDEHGMGNSLEMALQLGTHPDRKGVKSSIMDAEGNNIKYQPIDCSTGSLGQGLPIAVGMALANRQKNVYCMISDGEMSEGSIWEALRVASEQGLNNLKLLVNANGWGAYKMIDVDALIVRLQAFGWGVLPTSDDKKEITQALKTRLDNVPIAVFIRTEVSGLSEHYE